MLQLRACKREKQKTLPEQNRKSGLYCHTDEKMCTCTRTPALLSHEDLEESTSARTDTHTGTSPEKASL